MIEMISMANGISVPKACVDALTKFESTWPGATFPTARAAIVAQVISAYKALPVQHNLILVIVERRTYATYQCSCGVEGTATMATHLASLPEIKRRAIKNHELHQVRALRREAKKR